MAAADAALYAAKRAGRDAVRLSEELDPHDAALAVHSEAVALAEAVAATVNAHPAMGSDHSGTVAELAALVAAELELPPAVAFRVRLAAWLHDLGKVAMPDSILAKPGPLDEAEWEIMRGHPSLGERLVRRFPALAAAAPGVRHHHERFDGSGYPDRIAGEAIPVEARIVAAADAFAAMTSDRCYRPGLGREAALAELRAAAGGQLDPAVVRALLAVLTRTSRETPLPEAA
jgi:HD-GYP domain-containing protein (c-di-GMP phosphodiesterase class II)